MSAFCSENKMIRTGVYPRKRKRSKGESETTFPITVIIEVSCIYIYIYIRVYMCDTYNNEAIRSASRIKCTRLSAKQNSIYENVILPHSPTLVPHMCDTYNNDAIFQPHAQHWVQASLLHLNPFYRLCRQPLHTSSYIALTSIGHPPGK